MTHACRSLLPRLSLIAALFVPGCSPPPTKPSAPPTPQVVVGTPVKAAIVEWDEYVGRLEAIEFVEVRARVSGYLESTHFDEGLMVQQGDLLCIIDPRPFVAEVDRAKADVSEATAKVEQAKAAVIEAEANEKAAKSRTELARRQLDRSRRLVAQNATPREDFDLRESEFTQAVANQDAALAMIESVKAAAISAQAAEETAKAALEIAKLNLAYTKVYAPVTGRISRREVTEGNLISGGTAQSTLLTTIVSLNPIHCYFDADEKAFLKYVRLAREGKRQSSREVKNPVYVALADEPKGFPHKGHMDFVDNRLDPETDTMRGRAILPNPDLTLVPGLFTRLRLPGSSRHEAILIPDLAIGTDQSEKFVFVVGDDDVAKRQVVELGPIAKGLRVIRSGLKGDERVVLRGLQRVRPGSPVEAKMESITPQEDGLPDDYRPVPESEWLTPRRSTAKPEDKDKDQTEPAKEAATKPSKGNGPTPAETSVPSPPSESDPSSKAAEGERSPSNR